MDELHGANMRDEALFQDFGVVLASGPLGRVRPAILKVDQLSTLLGGTVEGTLSVSVLGNHVNQL